MLRKDLPDANCTRASFKGFFRSAAIAEELYRALQSLFTRDSLNNCLWQSRGLLDRLSPL